MFEQYTGLLPLVLAPAFRSIGGWLENALEDGEISKFEWTELGATMVRVGLIGCGLFWGLDLEPLAAGATAVLSDFVLKAIKKD